MSLYVLDTDILTLYQFGNQTVCCRVAEHTSEELAVAISSVEEQLSSWYTLLRQTKKSRGVGARISAIYGKHPVPFSPASPHIH